MNKAAGGFAFALLLTASFLDAGQSKDLPDNLTFTTTDNKTIASAELKASPLVLMVGAAWCPECRQKASEVQKAYLLYKDRGVRFLCVLGKSSDEDLAEFRETCKITYPVVKDNGLAEALGVRVIPQTFFYAKGGVFSKRIMGVATQKELLSNIETILRLSK